MNRIASLCCYVFNFLSQSVLKYQNAEYCFIPKVSTTSLTHNMSQSLMGMILVLIRRQNADYAFYRLLNGTKQENNNKIHRLAW